jgi:hypothetical protein
MSTQHTIYLDFDGTVVEHAYPEIGALNPGSIRVIRRLQDAGHKIILNTYRADLADGSLEEALQFLNDPHHALLEISEFTELKIHPPIWNWESVMASGILFIDDISEGTPMIPNIQLEFGRMVDWKTLEEWFVDTGFI